MAGDNKIVSQLAEAPNHPVAQGAFDGPIWIGWWTWIGIVLISIFWSWFKKKKISIASLIISLLLIILGFLSLAGIIETKHGHGVLEDNTQAEHLNAPGNRRNTSIKIKYSNDKS